MPSQGPDKSEAEARILELVKEMFDSIVLARYMQVLGSAIVEEFAGRVINIHHSFLPAFVGGRPYEQAYERGVKIIGATAHYVTAQLDEGPIIEQDVVRVNHAMDAADLQCRGAYNAERGALSRAVQWHAQDRASSGAATRPSCSSDFGISLRDLRLKDAHSPRRGSNPR